MNFNEYQLLATRTAAKQDNELVNYRRWGWRGCRLNQKAMFMDMLLIK